MLWVFLAEVERDGEGFIPVSLVMAVWSVVKVCVRSSRARAFSLDTRQTVSLGLRAVGVGVWVGSNGIEVSFWTYAV